jgi:hypothetical protein
MAVLQHVAALGTPATSRGGPRNPSPPARRNGALYRPDARGNVPASPHAAHTYTAGPVASQKYQIEEARPV